MPAPSAHRPRPGRVIDYGDVRQLAIKFGGMPAGLRRDLRPRLMAAGRDIAAQAKQNASWSTRIPKSIGVRANTSMKSGGVRIIARRKVAPHARPYEGIASRKPKFRHPVFAKGDNRAEWIWVDQQTRPFIQPAIKSRGPQARDKIADAVRGLLGDTRS